VLHCSWLANGTPMFCAGDEFLNTQQGNNNPYNQDNETTWLDWDRARAHQDVFRFFREMIAFRRRHPSIARRASGVATSAGTASTAAPT
jgi:glycogen operon protein